MRATEEGLRASVGATGCTKRQSATCIGRDHRRHEANRGCVVLTTPRGPILAKARIKSLPTAVCYLQRCALGTSLKCPLHVGPTHTLTLYRIWRASCHRVATVAAVLDRKSTR